MMLGHALEILAIYTQQGSRRSSNEVCFSLVLVECIDRIRLFFSFSFECQGSAAEAFRNFAAKLCLQDKIQRDTRNFT